MVASTVNCVSVDRSAGGLAARPEGRRPRPGRVAGRPAAEPRPVSRGENKGQDLVTSAEVDWIRAVGPRSELRFLQEWAGGLFGEMEVRPGRDGFNRGVRYAAGVQVFWADGEAAERCRLADKCMVEIPGQVLHLVSPRERMQWLKMLWKLQLKCRRLDCCVDFRGESIDIVGDVVAGCYAGELTGTRHGFDVRRPCRPDGTATGYGVYLGKRGRDGSGRFTRVYDKGLETGEASEGRWQRVEAEFSGKVAEYVQTLLVQAYELERQGLEAADAGLTKVDDVEAVVGWDAQTRALAMGAFDFRKANGETALKRRPRMDWWQGWLDRGKAVPRRVIAYVKRAADLDRKVKWLQRTAGGMIRALIDFGDMSIAEAARLCMGEVTPARRDRVRPWFWQLCELLGDASLGKGQVTAKGVVA